MLEKYKYLKWIQNTALYKNYRETRVYEHSPEYARALCLLNGAKNMVDLGCGTNPHPCAKVAVDKFITPDHRKWGENKNIDVNKMEAGGVRFVQADFEQLPFKDEEFDLAYSHHVMEHLENPAAACLEMQRIAQRGIVMCPSILAENIFGRIYHKWEITYKENLLIFMEKDSNKLWFGEGPIIMHGKIKKTKDCNPFDILLNEGKWYHGIHRYARLSKLLRKYWYGHYKNIENVFIWEGNFEYLIIYKDGRIETSIR